MKHTLEQIRDAIKSKGYLWFNSDTDYDVNIVGVRNITPGDAVTNAFDDVITVSFKDDGKWQFYSWPCTLDPGTKAVKEYHNPNGVARIVPGQYRRSHHIGLHQGKYEALTQQNPVTVYRDANKDMKFDETKTETGIFGINIHKAGTDSTLVDRWSEGCTVFKREIDFNAFMAICKEASKIHGNSFTYTVIEL